MSQTFGFMLYVLGHGLGLVACVLGLGLDICVLDSITVLQSTGGQGSVVSSACRFRERAAKRVLRDHTLLLLQVKCNTYTFICH